ncbi:MAG: hypothetical protein UV73_C0007G0070 [Candidatus Gottesmanbacteria bacterium GW2011_GWA2_43_14]|uniref:Transposase IS200-like domain-containing protein n=1 Tax=Candidatus Gottesmanbacteria bacterium GW2011_GWA2_43_14 TaxID=1618443 RepID=A0A0G1DJ78_9BACT|nr:MAG: hypothetical protein UV73_C0007G0070 [Candidatus Gottesmanbacteria bacterium GW2011_GWA2_43_14]
MPGRLVPLVNHEIYHVFNRGIDRRPTFTSKREYERALLALELYQYLNPPFSLSKILSLERQKRQKILKDLKKDRKMIQIYCYCLMPNHFHFLLEQEFDNGISKFLSNFQNSYTRFFNSLNKKDGAIFLNQFKAIRIETENQFIHVSRYIHLNPYTSYLIKRISDVESYPWSSFQSYLLKSNNNIVNTTKILSFFKDSEKYKEFILNQADYQRGLKRIEHLLLE